MNSILQGQIIFANQVDCTSIKEVQAYNKIHMIIPNNFQVAGKLC